MLMLFEVIPNNRVMQDDLTEETACIHVYTQP